MNINIRRDTGTLICRLVYKNQWVAKHFSEYIYLELHDILALGS